MNVVFHFRPFCVYVVKARLARTLAPHLPAPPARLAVMGSIGFARALEGLRYVVERENGEASADTVVADRPAPEAAAVAARLLRDRGRLVVIDRGWGRPPAERRTWELARAGFTEIGQTDVGRVRLTTGTRLRLP